MKRLCPGIYGRRMAYLGLHQISVCNFDAGRASVLKSLRYRRSLKYGLLYLISFLPHAQTDYLDHCAVGVTPDVGVQTCHASSEVGVKRVVA